MNLNHQVKQLRKLRHYHNLRLKLKQFTCHNITVNEHEHNKVKHHTKLRLVERRKPQVDSIAYCSKTTTTERHSN